MGGQPRIAEQVQESMAGFASVLQAGRSATRSAVQPAASNEIQRIAFHPTIEELGGEDALSTGVVRLGESENVAPVLSGPGVLAALVRRLPPDLLHSIEYQHAG